MIEKNSIRSGNIFMVKILWVLLFTVSIINGYIWGGPDTLFIFFLSFPLILIITMLIILKKSESFTMYAITLFSLMAISLINFFSPEFVNLFALPMPVVFSLVYREWKNTLLALSGSAMIFSFFFIKQGELYFTAYESADLLFFMIYSLIFAVIVLTEMKTNNRISRSLRRELKKSQQLQKDLKNSELKYRSMVKQSTEGICAFHPETKQFLEASERFCQIFGYSEEEMRRISLYDLATDADSIIDQKVLEIMDSSEYYIRNSQYIHKSGAVIDVKVRATKIILNKETAILAAFTDVTDSNRRKRELRRAKSVVDHMRDGVLVTDLNGNIEYVNPMFEQITGYREQEVLGRSVELLRSDQHEPEFHKRLWDHIQSNQVWEGEICNRRKDGRLFIQKTQICTVYNEENQPVQYTSVFRDITEQKQLEEKLEENEMKYRTLFNHNQGISFSFDKQGLITDVNERTGIIVGYRPDQLIGLQYTTFIQKSDLVKMKELSSELKKGEAVSFEVGFIHQSGAIVELSVMTAPIMANGSFAGAVGVAQDITEQKQAEKELMASEERYRKLIELYPEVVFVHNRKHIVFVNERAAEFIGVMNTEEILGKSAFDYIHEKDKIKAAHQLLRNFEGSQGTISTNQYRFIKNDGSVILTEVNTSIIDYNGEVAVLGVIRDITLQKKAEEQLKQANKMLHNISMSDGLTGINNRRSYDLKLAESWNQALVNQTPISLILFDIDHFKQFNDSYGHHQGDQCLKKIAQVLSALVKSPAHTAARYGGEEFAWILPGATEAEAYQAAEELRMNIQHLNIPHKGSSVNQFVTVSIGVATCVPDSNDTGEDLFERADRALYASKTSGKNQVNCCSKIRS
ncbi:diguanylate cyclase (GGDEF)-like protein/PAS domain S-box-containing protein [Bacillus ectoiniformans]|uniref:PAS domain S-box protein n=1 Tax=Bacillus ectoiniformans TaxID=1494429 RepID=UPI00195A554D|nr:PAS domain S-box protein [Bacillus ectoiniformans]MBM7649180.1 diguanylate cyclase (GGDEF)-like protein/PAS domain S-box-containing protein [Bacillus ectoiniformans]